MFWVSATVRVTGGRANQSANQFMARGADQHPHLVSRFRPDSPSKISRRTVNRQRSRLVYRAKSFSLGTRLAGTDDCRARSDRNAGHLSAIKARRTIPLDRQPE